jgi:hypothetical protein
MRGLLPIWAHLSFTERDTGGRPSSSSGRNRGAGEEKPAGRSLAGEVVAGVGETPGKLRGDGTRPGHVHGRPRGDHAGGGGESEANDGGAGQIEHQHVRPRPWEHADLPEAAHDALAMCDRSREGVTRRRCSALPARVMRRGSSGYARMRGRWRFGAPLARVQEGAWSRKELRGELC